MGAPAATVEASGFIWAISGTSVAAAPTAPAAPVATKRKSRRVGSAAARVVTVLILSVSHRAAGLADSRSTAAPNAAGGDRPVTIRPGTIAAYWHPCRHGASPLTLP